MLGIAAITALGIALVLGTKKSKKLTSIKLLMKAMKLHMIFCIPNNSVAKKNYNMGQYCQNNTD
jgi:hypothetical protein